MTERTSASVARRGLDAILGPWVFVPNVGLTAINASVGAAARLADRVAGGLGDSSAARRLGEANDRVARRANETAQEARDRTAKAGRATFGQGAGDMPAALMATVLETGVRTATLPAWLLRGEPGQAAQEQEEEILDEALEAVSEAAERVDAVEAVVAARAAPLEALMADQEALTGTVEALRADLVATRSELASSASESQGLAERLTALQASVDEKQADLTRALEERSALSQQLEAIQDQLAAAPEASRVSFKGQKWTDALEGGSRKWVGLPTPMELELGGDEVSGENLIVLVHLSRVQHTAANTNTEFRVLVNGAEAGRANTGNASGWTFRHLAFHGFAIVPSEEELRVEVQYKTQRGKVLWASDGNGRQDRRLTAISF